MVPEKARVCLALPGWPPLHVAPPPLGTRALLQAALSRRSPVVSLPFSWSSGLLTHMALNMFYRLNHGLDGKEFSCNAGNPGSVPGLRRSPGEENGYPLLYSCLENPIDRGAWWATVHGVTKSRTRLSD